MTYWLPFPVEYYRRRDREIASFVPALRVLVSPRALPDPVPWLVLISCRDSSWTERERNEYESRLRKLETHFETNTGL